MKNHLYSVFVVITALLVNIYVCSPTTKPICDRICLDNFNLLPFGANSLRQCLKGCSFYNLLQVIRPHLPKNETVEECHSLCQESYEKHRACSIGCDRISEVAPDTTYKIPKTYVRTMPIKEVDYDIELTSDAPYSLNCWTIVEFAVLLLFLIILMCTTISVTKNIKVKWLKNQNEKCVDAENSKLKNSCQTV